MSFATRKRFLKPILMTVVWIGILGARADDAPFSTPAFSGTGPQATPAFSGTDRVYDTNKLGAGTRSGIIPRTVPPERTTAAEAPLGGSAPVPAVTSRGPGIPLAQEATTPGIGGQSPTVSVSEQGQANEVVPQANVLVTQPADSNAPVVTLPITNNPIETNSPHNTPKH